MFDWQKPTVQMLGRWQPWHAGHTALFERALSKTGQVMIQVRDVQHADAGFGNDDNPFDFETVCAQIEQSLLGQGHARGEGYEIMLVPNIVHVTYARKVGYTLEREEFSEAVESVSATKIRAQMRKAGKL